MATSHEAQHHGNRDTRDDQRLQSAPRDRSPGDVKEINRFNGFGVDLTNRAGRSPGVFRIVVTRV